MGMNYLLKPIDFKSIKEMPEEDRPREKLHRSGAQALSDLELMCCVLGRGSRQKPVQDLAQEILDEVDSCTDGTMSVSALEKIAGLGSAGASVICASLELGRRLFPARRRCLGRPEDVFSHIRHYGDRKQEHMICILLNGALEVMATEVVSIGLVNRTVVHPREVFAEAVRLRATAVVVAHNHPSGNLTPSTDDLEVTSVLRRAGELLGIQLADHIIFSSDGYHSMAENGELYV